MLCIRKSVTQYSYYLCRIKDRVRVNLEDIICMYSEKDESIIRGFLKENNAIINKNEISFINQDDIINFVKQMKALNVMNKLVDDNQKSLSDINVITILN